LAVPKYLQLKDATVDNPKHAHWMVNAKLQTWSVTLDSDQSQHQYIGLTSATFKQRYSRHKSSFSRDTACTKLSDFIKTHRLKNTNFKIEWSIEKLANTYNQNSKNAIFA
jgi:hypothetical protein